MAAPGKGALALLLGKADDDGEGEDMGGGAKKSAAQSLIDAVKDGNADAVADAFESLYDHCMSKPDEPDSEDDSDDMTE